jgi:hypothetical protein
MSAARNYWNDVVGSRGKAAAGLTEPTGGFENCQAVAAVLP